MGLGLCLLWSAATALELMPQRTQVDDLVLTGPLGGISTGETRHVSRASPAWNP
jgi:hypothetical protein